MSKQFQYNEHGCCLNPYSEIVHECDRFIIKIRTACRGGVWTWGYEFWDRGLHDGSTCGSSGCCFNEYRKDRMYGSKQQAREAAAIFIRNHYKHVLLPRKALQALQEVFTPQLTLFT